MPEAVIVAAARTPIGRAFKGSLREVRPDDLATDIVRAALAQVLRRCAEAHGGARRGGG
jgi:acetyl-CoA C-acetyltransferase